VIAGFGSGALFFTPMMNFLTNKFTVLPTYLGSSLDVIVEGGKQFATVGGKLQESAPRIIIKKFVLYRTVPGTGTVFRPSLL
jgi:hypothetical protein